VSAFPTRVLVGSRFYSHGLVRLFLSSTVTFSHLTHLWLLLIVARPPVFLGFFSSVFSAPLSSFSGLGVASWEPPAAFLGSVFGSLSSRIICDIGLRPSPAPFLAWPKAGPLRPGFNCGFFSPPPASSTPSYLMCTLANPVFLLFSVPLEPLPSHRPWRQF